MRFDTRTRNTSITRTSRRSLLGVFGHEVIVIIFFNPLFYTCFGDFGLIFFGDTFFSFSVNHPSLEKGNQTNEDENDKEYDEEEQFLELFQFGGRVWRSRRTRTRRRGQGEEDEDLYEENRRSICIWKTKNIEGASEDQ